MIFTLFFLFYPFLIIILEIALKFCCSGFQRRRQIEAINGAWAMIGLTAGLVIEGHTGKPILTQVKLLSSIFFMNYRFISGITSLFHLALIIAVQ